MVFSEICIGDRKIGKKHPCYIIAEAGVNHNGDIELATKLIDKAKKCDVDAIKFQTWKTENIVQKHAPMAKYQKLNVPSSDNQYDLIKSLELPFSDFEYLKTYADDKELTFLSTPFDVESANFLEKISIEAFKIASGEITNPFLLDCIASFQKPIIMSTGMATLGDIESALKRFYSQNVRNIILLHCITSYPAKIEEANVNAIPVLEKVFQHLVGLSDHTIGNLIPVLSVAKGAVLIEKHFTLDKSMQGPDHKASLDPSELAEMVSQIRLSEKALGTGKKIPTASELEIAEVARKSLVSLKPIRKGECLTEENLTVKRPGTGIDPRLIDMIRGQKARKDIEEDVLLSWDMIDLE